VKCSVSYTGRKWRKLSISLTGIFNSLPLSVTILQNNEAKLKAALRKYLHTQSLYSVDEFFMCKDDLQYFHKMFVVFYSVNLYMCTDGLFTSYFLYDTLMDPWNVCMKSKVNFHSFKHSKGV
jgi:hypothetical protein